MAHNIFHTATDWVNDKVIDPIADYATDKYVDYKIDQYVDSFTDEFKGPSTITPDMAAEGWKYGLDGVPYNSSIAMFPEDFETDSNVTPRPGNTGPDFVANNTTASTSPFLSQDLRQRTPSGTIYNPSIEAYNNASLFDYAGPGGVAEYTYGQGLPMDYGVYGTPPGPNLYYEGQFGEGYVEPEVADSAINLPPITMPDGVPQLPTPGNLPTTTPRPTPRPTQPNMPAFTGSGSGMDASLLVGQADQGPDIGLLNYTNNGTVSAADQAIFDEAKMSMMPNSGPNIYDTQYTSVPYQIGGEEQVFDGSYNMQPSDDGAFAYGGSQSNQGNFETANQMVGGSLPTNIMRNPNEETQQYQGIYVDPRTVPEIDDVTTQTFMPSFPADYGDGTNIQTITDVPYISDVPIVASDIENPSVFQDIDDGLFEINFDQVYPSDNYSPAPQYGLDEAAVDAYDFITSGNTGNANSGIVQAVLQPATTSGYAGNIIVNPYTIDMSASEMAYQDAVANPVVQPIVETPIVDTGPDLNSLMQQMSGGTDNEYDYAPYSTGAIDAIVANSILQNQAVASSPAPAPVSIPSIFRPRPTPAPTVFASPGGAPGFTSYGPPNLQLVGGR